jgi:L-fuconolactonase
MNTVLCRRHFLGMALLGLAGAGQPPALAAQGATASTPNARFPGVIDTHVHFYDPARPQGVPWPPKEDPVLYHTMLPEHYSVRPQPQAVAGVVVVEASPWLEDNQWMLELAAKHPVIKGMVGNLPVGREGFQAQLRRFAGQSAFRGLRLRPAPSRDQWEDPQLVKDLRAVADQNLSLDLVGGLETLELASRWARAVPGLRIVIDHLASVRIDGRQPDSTWLAGIGAAARHENVFLKVSGLVEGTGLRDGKAPTETAYYKPTLDAVWAAFGEDRLIYASNWPVCEHYAKLATVQRLPAEYFGAQGARVLEKVLSINARKAYKWGASATTQP